MAAQKDYRYSTPKGVPGGKVDIAFDEVVTRINEAEDGALKFGMAAVVGSSPGHNVTVPGTGATAGGFDGVVLHHPNTEHGQDGVVRIKKDATVGIMRKGHVWARTADGITPAYGEKAYVCITGDDAGAFTNVADGALDVGAVFGNASDDGIAVIHLR